MYAINFRTVAQFILSTLLVLMVTPLFADAVFMKDGSLIEGTIESEDDARVTLVGKSGIKMEIPTKNAIRAVRGKDYQKRYTIKKTDGTELKAHIVSEERSEYICRPKLDSPREITLSKGEVAEVVDARGNARKSTFVENLSLDMARKAAWVALVPPYSGSFISGEKPLYGYMFAGLKTAFLLGPFLAPMGSTFTSSVSSNATDKYFKSTPYMIYLGISLGLWAVTTALDAVYSYNFVESLMRKSSATAMSGRELYWSLQLRQRVTIEDAYYPLYCDGAEVQVSLRF